MFLVYAFILILFILLLLVIIIITNLKIKSSNEKSNIFESGLDLFSAFSQNLTFRFFLIAIVSVIGQIKKLRIKFRA